MDERLSQEYLEAVAKTLDELCIECNSTTNARKAETNRGAIRVGLQELGRAWDGFGAKGTVFTNKLQTNCNICFSEGRKDRTLEKRLTCGIRVRVPEKI